MKNWAAKLKMRLPAILLLFLSLIFWGFYDRYESAGPVLLDAPEFTQATRVRGDCSEEEAAFVLRVPESGKTARMNFGIPGASEYKRIRIRGRIKVDGVKEGRHPWSCARLLLAQYDADGKWIPVHHTLKAASGTRDWKQHENVFVIQPEAVQVDLIVQQIGEEGTARFDQLRAEPVSFRPSFPVWRLIFAVLWLGMAVLFFHRCRMGHRRLRWLILLNVLAILSGTLMPERYIQGITDVVKQTITRMVPDQSAPEAPVSKEGDQGAGQVDLFNAAIGSVHQTGHFLLFASLCFLVYVSAFLEQQHWIYFFKVAFDVLLYAAISESLQYLTVDRTPGITDWLTDVYGMIAAFVLFLPLSVLGRLLIRSR